MTTATTITTEIPMQRVLDMLVGAFDSSAIRYWLVPDDEGDTHDVVWPNDEPVDPDTLDWLPADEKPWDCRDIYFAPLVEGGAVVLFVDPANTPDGSGRVRLDLDTIRRGLVVMADQHPRHFADMREEDFDAVTYDTFVQCCVFGETLY